MGALQFLVVDSCSDHPEISAFGNLNVHRRSSFGPDTNDDRRRLMEFVETSKKALSAALPASHAASPLPDGA
jgi:hypothetical protein